MSSNWMVSPHIDLEACSGVWNQVIPGESQMADDTLCSWEFFSSGINRWSRGWSVPRVDAVTSCARANED